MNKDSLIDFLGFIIVKVASLFFSLLPLPLALWIGRRMGEFALFFNLKRRSIAYANLKSAFPSKGSGEIKRILRTHYQNLGMNVAEILKLPFMGKSYLDRHVIFQNAENIRKALDKNKGVILLSAHFGNWELANLAMSSQGHSVSVFAREQKYPRLNKLLNKSREITGSKVVVKGFSVREIIKTLHANGMVGVLADQDAGAKGIFVDFFNRPTSTAPGQVLFSLKTGAIILPTFIRRVNVTKHELVVGEALELIDTGAKEKDLVSNLSKITEILEGYIKKFPAEWLWSHKRWKTTTERTVLVLSEGKRGHLNQAVAVADMVKEALSSRLEARGIKEKPVVKIKVAEVRFKNHLTRMLLDFSSLFSSRRCQGCLSCLKFCLKKESFDEIRKYADIVISCGASTVGANIILKNENNAKNIVIMKPGLGRKKRFDLNVLPSHDARGKVTRNTLITDLTPNSIVHRDTNNGIGILIGGDAKGFRLKKEAVEKVISGVLRVSQEMNRDISATTSRRTSPETEFLLKDRLGVSGRCKMLVIANENNPEGALHKILNTSEVVIVSPESISMISEAISSGKRVAVFRDNVLGVRSNGKYERAIRDLEAKGYISIVAPDEIYATLKDFLGKTLPTKKLRDRENIIKRLEGII
ncbi:ELM1/GtrOC1 family putative glycosyltransferase [Candidatus Omnitrophota bacterium]